MTGNDAVEMMLAGANLIAIGTACFDDPYAPIRIISEIEKYMKRNGIDKVSELTGKVVLN